MVINSIPSSCTNQNCGFNYSTEATPLIDFVYPSSGQQGTSITLYGSGFQGSGDGYVRVWLGEAECLVTSFNDSEITCTAGAHPAGSVRVTALVPGRGYASVNDSTVCFSYRLSLTDVYPTAGSTEGGTLLTLRGHGFLPTAPVDPSSIGSPLDSTAWLANGLGWPVLPPSSTLCPYLADQLSDTPLLTSEQTLQYLLLYMYSNEENETQSDAIELDQLQLMIELFYRDFPVSVFIGSSPCVVTAATLDEMNCTTTRHEAGSVGITVSVLGEMASLSDGYYYDRALTPTISSVYPSSGPVYGGTAVSIEGQSLADTVSVMIGDALCVR